NCRERSRNKSGRQPPHPCRTRGKSCSSPLDAPFALKPAFRPVPPALSEIGSLLPFSTPKASIVSGRGWSSGRQAKEGCQFPGGGASGAVGTDRGGGRPVSDKMDAGVLRHLRGQPARHDDAAAVPTQLQGG